METAEVKKLRYAIHPRAGWVLVKKISQELEKVGDLYVDKSQSRSLRAEVVEAAKPSDLTAGDIVLITAFGMEIEDLEEMTGEKGLLLLREEEVYASAELLNDETT